MMAEPLRIAAGEVYKKLQQGGALLVCAYEEEEKYREFKIEGSLSLSEFEAKLPSLSKNQEIIFYCA